MTKTAGVLIKDLSSQNLRQFFAIVKAGFGRIRFLALMVHMRKFSTLTKLEATQTLLEKMFFCERPKVAYFMAPNSRKHYTLFCLLGSFYNLILFAKGSIYMNQG